MLFSNIRQIKNFLSCILPVLFSAIVSAQPIEPINTDRPDQSDGVYILPAKSFQIETGFVFSENSKRLSDISQSTMLRYGLHKNWEVRLLIDEDYHSDNSFKAVIFELSPVTISSKLSLCKQNKLLPAITLVSYLQLPFAATKPEQLDYLAPTVLLAFENALNERFSLGYNAGVFRDGVVKQNNYLVRLSLSCTMADKFSMFGEYFSTFNQTNAPDHNFDFGLQYLLRPQIQVDIAAGTSLFDKGNTRFETAGLSYRFH